MTRFQTEIEGIPGALKALIAYYRGEGAKKLAAFAELARDRELFFSGMGTSLFAPEVAFGRITRSGRVARSVDAGEWLHHGTLAPKVGQLVILTSQSGGSVELVKLVERGTGLEGGYVAVTNNEASALGRGARLVLPLHAGDEASISTKTYANSLAVFSLLASALEGQGRVAETLTALDACATALAVSPEVEEAADALASATSIGFVGRGPAFAAARQCALTFMEGTRIPCAPFTGGAFNHGPFECAGPGYAVVVLDAGGKTSELAAGLAARARTKGSPVVVLGPHRPAAGIGVPVPTVESVLGEELYPLLLTVAQNTLIHAVSQRRGHEAGIFRHGEKVTTHE